MNIICRLFENKLAALQKPSCYVSAMRLITTLAVLCIITTLPAPAQNLFMSPDQISTSPCAELQKGKGLFNLSDPFQSGEPPIFTDGTPKKFARIRPSHATFQVENLADLQCALEVLRGRGGGTIYVKDQSDIDLTGHPIVLSRNIILASGRGLKGSAGARLFTRDREVRPMIEIAGSEVRITGLRIEGPSKKKAFPTAMGILAGAIGDCLEGEACLEIDHCELSGWPRSAVSIRGFGDILNDFNSVEARKQMAGRIHIHDNYIHHNQSKLYQGSSHAGYGVEVRDAYALIEKNIFDYNRHAIAGSGFPKSGYIARHNLVLPGQDDFKNRSWQPAIHTHAFDMHMHQERSGGCCRAAGEFIHIHQNSFQFRKRYQTGWPTLAPAIKVRGRPESPSIIEENVFRHEAISNAVNQANAKGRLTVINNKTGFYPLWQYRAGDFDGDGKADLFQATGQGFYYSSGGTFVWQHLLASSEKLPELGFGDFNGDGLTDLFRALNGRWEVSWSSRSEWTRLNVSNVPVQDLVFGDFDGDGKTDVFRSTGGKWYISWSGTSSWVSINSSGYQVHDLGFGDFDGDGKTDVFKSASGTWHVSWGGASSWDQIKTSSYIRQKLAFGDFDGDGKTDVFRSEGGRWYYSSAGRSRWERLYGADWPLSKYMLIADFTGDRRVDITNPRGRRLLVSPAGKGKPQILNADFLL